MAAPIAHIFCALFLLYSGAIEVDDEAAFIVGTLFPDIRYLGVIKRHETHEKNVTWDRVKNAATSFKKGYLLHSLLDEVREEFVEKYNLYDYVPDSVLRTQVLKLYEDMLLYEMVKNWSEVSHYFDTIFPEECAYGIEKSYVKVWHILLKQYIAQQPDPYRIFLLLQRYTALSAQRESDPIKRFLIRCKGALFNRIAYIKITLMINELKKSKKLKAAIMFFYNNINKFLVT